jgi:PhzF family phenazine biosynthesis protein
MPTLACYIVDAFTDRAFGGNPAAVCPLDAWLPDALMQSIAAEMNLSETAFFVRGQGDMPLRWFTPRTEVDLCGHATLASAFVLLHLLEPERREVRFSSRSGPLGVRRQGEALVLDFPATPPTPTDVSAPLTRALGRAPSRVMRARDVVAVYDSAEDVRALSPDMRSLAALEGVFAVCATAPGTGSDSDVDFVSRFFAPSVGIDEDPVTGSAHCALTPYWAERLGKTQLRARQVSARGGELACTLLGNRVEISGRAVLVLEGALRLESTTALREPSLDVFPKSPSR